MPDGGQSLILRADAGTRMGTGHVMRCLALAQAWKDAGGAAVFASAGITPGLESRLSAEGMEIARLSAKPGSSSDALETAKVAKGRGARWIVVDGYQFGGDYQQAVKQTGVRLLVVDDNGHADHYWADLVLSQNLHAQEPLYQARQPYTRLLLGTRYVLLRREFRQWQGRRRAVPAVARRLLVTMGGGDPDNVTLKVLQALEPLEIDGLETRVVVGNGNPHHEGLRAFARDSRIPTRIEANVTGMPQRMAWADAAVTAGGSTTWELAYFGVPSITMILADNQEASVNLLMRRGVFPTLGWASTAEAATIRDTVHRLLLDPDARERHRDRAAGLVDGAGADRVMQLLNSE